MIINTERFQLKSLTTDDVTEKYLSWFSSSKEVGKYVIYAQTNVDITNLKQYVKEREGRKDVLFLGIFADSNQHIGNVKYEPINLKDKTATMGILIGEKDWQGKGVAVEVIEASSMWLKEGFGIEKILLGVGSENTRAVKAYEKIGFKGEQGSHTNTMVWDIK